MPGSSSSSSDRRRRRRRTRNHPVRRRRRRVGYVALGLLLVVGVLGALLAWDVVRTRRALVDARAHFAGARSALAEGAVDDATQELDEARDRITRAQTLTGRALWRFGESVPVAGRSLRNVSGVVDVAGAASRVARQVVDRAGGFVGDGGDLKLEFSGGEVSLEPIELAASALADLDIGPLQDAAAALGDQATYLVPDRVVEGRRQALELSHELLTTVERSGRLLSSLPTFLGGEGQRRYFLAMQNSAELRGTGGLIGFWSVLTVDDGAFRMSEPQVYGVLDRDPDEPEEDLTPVATSDEFRRRYQQANAAGFFANVNVDPDLPTTAEVLVDLYQQRTGERLDGVVAMDPVGLGHVMGPIGPVDVPDELTQPPLPDPVPPRDIAQVTMVHVYDVLGGGTRERKDYLREFARVAFQTVLDGGWDAVAVGRRMADAASGGHLQLYSTNEAEQEAFVHLGLGGAMAPAGSDRADGDLLAVTANNAAGNKMDVHVGHTLTGDVRLSPEGEGWRRDAMVRVSVDNPLPDSGRPDYIIQTCPTATWRPKCGEGQKEFGINRTWFTVWSPESTTLVEARNAAGDPLLVGVGAIHGEHAVDHFLETSSESSNHFEVDLSGPVELESDGRDRIYRLRLWRQAKAIADRVDLTVHPPEGMRIADATITGGGDGSGMGVHDDVGPEVNAELMGDGKVRITGDMNADVDLEIRLGPPPRSVWQRVRDWLGDPAF